MTFKPVVVSPLSTASGRALYVKKCGTIYVSSGYTVFRSHDWGASWKVDCRIRTRIWQSALAKNRVAARLLRQYIAAIEVLSNGIRLAVVRDGIYRAEAGELEMTRVFEITRGSRPLNLTVDREDRVLFGEYGDNAERHEVHLYASVDRGSRFEVAHTFKPGEVRHIHNVLYDRYRDLYWVLVGDYGREPGIAVMDRNLGNLAWIARSSQDCRVVSAIVERDCLLYGTDTEIDENKIIRIDKDSGRMDSCRAVEGSSFHAARFGEVRVISTCVEPSKVNRSKTSTLYASTDGERWEDIVSYRKDLLPFRLFQFGTIVLPSGESETTKGMFSGQALSGLDNSVKIVEFQVPGHNGGSGSES